VSEVSPIRPPAEVDLDDDQRAAIEEAGGWSLEAYAELGAAYLDYSEAEARYLQAKARLTKAKGGALEADMKRGNVVAAIAAGMSLPPGEWTYDSKRGKLVKRSS